MSKRLASAAELNDRLAALEGDDWDSGSDQDDVIPLPEPPVATLSKRQRNKVAAAAARKGPASDSNGMSSVVYVGHIPHGFYEEQMRGFFSQFGDVS